jgi:hypothetical protein
MILLEYWEIERQEKELLKEIAKWRYRAKHFSEDKKFLSDIELNDYLKTGIFKASYTASEILQEYKNKLKALKTKEYKITKRILKRGIK